MQNSLRSSAQSTAIESGGLADEMLLEGSEGALVAALLRKVRNWFHREDEPETCLQCGFPPGREFLIATDEAIIHPHQCSWCKTILFVPGPVFSCTMCSSDGMQRPAA
jgi:hypothetical protein